MPKVSAFADIPASAEVVFDFIADFRNIPRLQPHFTSVRLVSEQERGLGATIELTGRFHGMPMRILNRIVAYTPPHRLVSISEGTILSRNAWELEQLAADPPLTRVTLAVEYKVAGPFGKLFTGLTSSLFHNEIQEMTDGSLLRLKELVGLGGVP